MDEEAREMLSNAKAADQTYSDVVKELVQMKNRKDLADKIRWARENRDEMTSWDDV